MYLFGHLGKFTPMLLPLKSKALPLPAPHRHGVPGPDRLRNASRHHRPVLFRLDFLRHPDVHNKSIPLSVRLSSWLSLSLYDNQPHPPQQTIRRIPSGHRRRQKCATKETHCAAESTFLRNFISHILYSTALVRFSLCVILGSYKDPSIGFIWHEF